MNQPLDKDLREMQNKLLFEKQVLGIAKKHNGVFSVNKKSYHSFKLKERLIHMVSIGLIIRTTQTEDKITYVLHQ